MVDLAEQVSIAIFLAVLFFICALRAVETAAFMIYTILSAGGFALATYLLLEGR